jgi:hypothetical protein
MLLHLRFQNILGGISLLKKMKLFIEKKTTLVNIVTDRGGGLEPAQSMPFLNVGRQPGPRVQRNLLPS